ncbi:Mitochondrial ATPase inhibitor, IATP [Aspergillus sp. HF37]|nr:Mitochondrial ATPase inhibitor, IATP [Aspergillus sp. HF37]
MLRQSVTRPLSSSRPMLNRSFSSLTPRMGEGDTGAPKSSQFKTGGDAFQRREAAQESKYIHDKEMQRLHDLKGKINEQRQSLDDLEKHINDLSGGQGGHK